MKSLTWMISVHVKEIVRKIIRFLIEKEIHKIYEKGVKVECVNIQIFARTQQL